MNALLIGGTGTISMAITRLLVEKGWEVHLLNRGTRKAEAPQGVHWIQADISDEQAVAQILQGRHFDCVGQFIGFLPEQVERDIRLFEGKTNQYLYISSASAYHKPAMDYRITEGTALANPYWEYSRNKIACEEVLMKAYRERQFPVTIIRPSHTYDNRNMPLGVHGDKGSYQVILRMLQGKPVIIHGDGTSLWTMTHNSDFAKGYVGLMGNPHAIGEAFQITNDETLTWNQIYSTIARVLGVELKAYHVSSEFLAATGKYDLLGSLIGDKANSVVFDNSKLKRAVPDFVPTVRFEQGIRDTIENIMAHPELQKEDPEFDEWCDKVIEVVENAKKAFQNA
ncbi:MAG: SDR family oxidoreductase [Candidatus Faecousia sp.]|nr:SDR family oxidoreductase [Candidatus Faecousia sp.]